MHDEITTTGSRILRQLNGHGVDDAEQAAS
jgi:hypothetical protein